MRATKARLLHQEALTRYADGERHPIKEGFQPFYRLIKQRWTRDERVG